MPGPSDFGLPKKFSSWRPGQEEAVYWLAAPGKRFRALSAPTGSGKSVIYETAAALDGRTAILTSTKALQAQLLKDFGGVDIRGRSNYVCRMNTRVNCDQGLCLVGFKCPMRTEGGCAYFDQLKLARKSKLVVTNYAYWLALHEHSDGLGDFDFLVLDEVHSLPSQLISYKQITLMTVPRGMRYVPDMPKTVQAWREWAEGEVDALREDLEWARMTRRESTYLKIRRHLKVIEAMCEMDDSWVWEPIRIKGKYHLRPFFSPVQPAKFAHLVFMDIPKVLLTSATLVPKTLSLLGVEDCDFKTMPSTFPKEHRWFTHLPTLKINYSTTLGENKVWVKKVDKIIQTYRGKGIIHTVSYKRRDFLLTHSRYRSRMITHNSDNIEEVIEKFRKAEGGILVSPSITTGYDFPGDQCRWQIIVKLPFPSPKGVLRYEQHKQDPEFTPYMVAQTLVQAVGRGVRSADDYCQTFILDDNVAWFMRTYKRFFPTWFLESYRKRITIPKQKEK